MVNLSISLLIFTIALMIQNVLSFKQQHLIQKEIITTKQKYSDKDYCISIWLERGNLLKPGCLVILVSDKNGVIVDLKVLFGRMILAKFVKMENLIFKNLRDITDLYKTNRDIKLRAIEKAAKYIIENYALNI